MHARRLRRAPGSRLPSTAVDHPVGDHPQHARGHLAGVVRAGPRARERGTSVPSGVYPRSTKNSVTVRSPALGGQPQQRRAGQAEHRQRRVEVADRRHDRRGLRLVVHDGVVERTVRLDVPHAGARDAGTSRRAHRAGRRCRRRARRHPRRRSGGRTRRGRGSRPVPRPTTPRCAAAAHVRRSVVGSPAWKPHATLAEVTTASIASSSPSTQRPKDSPRSEFRSTVTDWPTRRARSSPGTGSAARRAHRCRAAMPGSGTRRGGRGGATPPTARR